MKRSITVSLFNSLLSWIIVLGFFQLPLNYHAQFNPDSLMHIEVLGNSTDPYINGDLGKKHQVFYNPTSTSNNTLLLHLVGTIDNPNGTTYFPTLATENGFHVINLMYRNWTSAQSACADSTDPDCYLNFRKEIIEGVDYSDIINVNAANSINNRLIKLLEYLNTNYPTQSWDQFYSGTSILWDKIMVSGHSQGGGHAAVIAITQPIQRVLMFASPNDYSDTLNSVASWTSASHIVPDSNYYGFNAYYDDVIDFWKQMEAWDALGLNGIGDTVNVDLVNNSYNGTRQLYTKQIVPSGGLEDLTHNIMIRDNQTPTNLSGVPEYLPVWKYMLGIEDPVNEVGENDRYAHPVIYPNPTSGILNITHNSIEAFTINVYDQTGTLCATYRCNSSIDLSDQSSGVYILEYITEESSNRYFKMIIE